MEGIGAMGGARCPSSAMEKRKGEETSQVVTWGTKGISLTGNFVQRS